MLNKPLDYKTIVAGLFPLIQPWGFTVPQFLKKKTPLKKAPDPTVLILVNRYARGGMGKDAKTFIEGILSTYPEEQQKTIRCMAPKTTEAMQHAIDTHAATLHTVIAVGGDGTINKVVSAMMAYPHLRLGIIPLGSGNRLATNLNIPANMNLALETALHGTPYTIDIGLCNGSLPFLYAAGCGIDADMLAHEDLQAKRWFGMLGYASTVIKELIRMPVSTYTVTVDDQPPIIRNGVGVFISNDQKLFGPFGLSQHATPNDGEMEVAILAVTRWADYIQAMWQVITCQFGSAEAKKGIIHLKGKHIHVDSAPTVNVELDGDIVGPVPLNVEVKPNALTVLVPQAADTAPPPDAPH